MTPSPDSAPSRFLRLTSEADRKAFYKTLGEPKWWMGGGKKDFSRGWVEIFKQTDWKCIYCDRDLATSTDALAESTEEHLVPRSLLEVNGVHASTAYNMAACCAGCNGLKNESMPPSAHPCWKTRKAYVKECRRFVAEQRFRNFQKDRAHVENVLKDRAGQ
jgi:hypothetical protein